MCVPSLGQEDPLEKGLPTHSSILAWRNPWMEEPGGLQSLGSQTVGNDLTTQQHKFVSYCCHRKFPPVYLLQAAQIYYLTIGWFINLKICLTGLKLRCQQGTFDSGVSRGKSMPCPYQPLEVIHIPWFMRGPPLPLLLQTETFSKVYLTLSSFWFSLYGLPLPLKMIHVIISSSLK